MTKDKVYLIRIWDEYASSKGDWENQSVALTLEDAKAEQAVLAKRGFKTNVSTLQLIRNDNH